MQTRKFLTLLMSIALFVGCASASQLRRDVQDDKGDKLTVGTVQRQIKVGMSSAEVAEVLGSPNVVSTDEERREVWIYDKIATDRVSSESSGGVSLLLVSSEASSSAGSVSQRTLTVIIKFDAAGKVRDFAYHTSRF
jgi:outer membrane protein assembly factor BamE (lipoprotein component of BamABCDE complex)